MADEDQKQAQVLLEIENRALHKGMPYLLLRFVGQEESQEFALAQSQAGVIKLVSPRVTLERAVDVAYRIAGGDARMMTDPSALRGLAVAILAGVAIGGAAQQQGDEYVG